MTCIWNEFYNSKFSTTGDSVKNMCDFLNWKELRPPSELILLKRKIVNFYQEENEEFYQCWDRFKSYVYSCPHYGFKTWYLIGLFYDGLNSTWQGFVNMLFSVEYLCMYPDEVWSYFDKVVQNVHINNDHNYGTIEEELSITPHDEITPHFSIDPQPVELELLPVEVNIEPIVLVDTTSMAEVYHVEEPREDLLVEKHSNKISNLGWDFIFGYDLLDATHNSCLHALLFTFIISPHVDHSQNMHCFEKLNRIILVGSNDFNWDDPYLINFKKRKKLIIVILNLFIYLCFYIISYLFIYFS